MPRRSPRKTNSSVTVVVSDDEDFMAVASDDEHNVSVGKEHAPNPAVESDDDDV